MAKLTIKLIKKEEIAQDTMAFHFEKPEGFAFTAGQFGDFTLINPPITDEEGNTRGFSLAYAPYEEDLVVATRMRNTAFKNVLKELPLGSEVNIDAPYGSFVLHKKDVPAVFLTGGIGITPARSIIAEATHNMLPHKIFLFYSNKTPKDSAFLEDLESFAKENPNFTFVPVMTRTSEEDQEVWSGETGHITKEMISKYITDLTTPIYYLSGPAGMVSAMRQVLTELEVDEDNIRSEEFSGY